MDDRRINRNKSNIRKVILVDNVFEQRHLALELQLIAQQQKAIKNVLDSQRRSFVVRQLFQQYHLQRAGQRHFNLLPDKVAQSHQHILTYRHNMFGIRDMPLHGRLKENDMKKIQDNLLQEAKYNQLHPDITKKKPKVPRKKRSRILVSADIGIPSPSKDEMGLPAIDASKSKIYTLVGGGENLRSQLSHDFQISRTLPGPERFPRKKRDFSPTSKRRKPLPPKNGREACTDFGEKKDLTNTAQCARSPNSDSVLYFLETGRHPGFAFKKNKPSQQMFQETEDIFVAK